MKLPYITSDTRAGFKIEVNFDYVEFYVLFVIILFKDLLIKIHRSYHDKKCFRPFVRSLNSDQLTHTVLNKLMSLQFSL